MKDEVTVRKHFEDTYAFFEDLNNSSERSIAFGVWKLQTRKVKIRKYLQ